MAIETNELIDVKTLRPFKRFIMTIGNLPSSYLESMTYGEMLMWFCNYLQETVIPTVNNNGEAVEELQNLYEELKSYVDNYFENLDVQEEINNKLDEMAQNGSLTNLIKTYVDPIYQDYENRIDNQINLINTKVNSVTSYAPIPVSSVSDMTDITKLYLNTTDGEWYYYDGTDWVSGGTYQGTTLSTDDEARMEKLESEVYVLNLEYINDGYTNTSGTVTSSNSHKCTDLIPIKYFNKLSYTNYEGLTAYAVAFYNENEELMTADSILGDSNIHVTAIDIPLGAKYVRLSNYTSHDTPNAVLLKTNSLGFNFEYLKDDLSVYDTIKGDVLELNATLDDNSYIDANGYPVYNANTKRSDFINVKGFDKIKYKLYIASQNYTVAFYDKYKAFLGEDSIHGTGNTDEDVIDIPSNAYYVIFSNYKNNTSPYAILYKTNSLISKIAHNSILNGKNVGFLGDSITNGYKANLPFRTIIANNTGCIQHNYGINGSTLSTSGSNPACERYADMDDDLDYICVLIGINDSTQMGTEDSTDTSTFYGALNTLITGLITKYTTKKIMFCTLLQKRNINVANKNNAIRSRCAYYNIPCYDLHVNSQLNANIDIVNQTMYAEEDGLHPNDLGHAMLANKIQKALESI